MSSIKDKLASSVRQARDAQPPAADAAIAAADKPAKAPAKRATAPAAKPTTTPAAADARVHADPTPSSSELHPRRVWPD